MKALLALMPLVLAQPVVVEEIDLGPRVIGDRCGVDADCAADLQCFDNVCRKKIAPKKVVPLQLRGLHFFGGIVLMIGAGLPERSPSRYGSGDEWGRGGSPMGVEYLFGFRGGVFFDRHEIAIELSPVTYSLEDRLYARNTPACAAAGYACRSGPLFQVNGTYRHFVPIHESATVQLYWPVGAGVGLLTETTSSLAYFQARADVLGLALKVDHLVFDFYLPSFRWGVTNAMMTVEDRAWPAPHCRAGDGYVIPCASTTAHLFSWLVGVGGSYVF